MIERLRNGAAALLRAWARWVAFLSTREDATSLAVARIISGSTIAWNLLSMLKSGAAAQAWVDHQYGGAHNTFSEVWLQTLGGATPGNIRALIFVGIAAGLMMALGAATRASTFVTWLCFHTLTDTNYLAGGSSDDLLLNGLFVLLWSGSGRALSVDHWWRRRRDPLASSDAPAWPRYVLIFQICTVYWTTGMQKVSSAWWPPPFGSLDAIWFILQEPTWTRFTIPAQTLRPFFRLTQLATLTTWLFENSGLLLLLAYWYRATRKKAGRVRAFFNAPLGVGRKVDFRLCYLAVGLSLHLGIWSLMQVGPFLNSVLVCYACCITPGEWRSLIERIGGARNHRTVFGWLF